MTVGEQISRLKLEGDTPSSEIDLAEIERLSGLTLAPAFRALWLAVGGCVVRAKIGTGRQAGQDVAEFWAPRTIIEKLKEDRLPRVVPFGEDIWGNWFFVDELGAVRLVDWNANRVEPISRSFEEFLTSLEPADG